MPAAGRAAGPGASTRETNVPIRPAIREAQPAVRFRDADACWVASVSGAGTFRVAMTAHPRIAGEIADDIRKLTVTAFNRATAQDARLRFPDTVQCRTAHSLAFAATGQEFRGRLNARPGSSWE